MSDTNPSTDAPKPDESKATDEHPWGDDFDAARAWKSLTAARELEKDLKAKVAAYEKAEQDAADANKTELEKANARAEKAEQAAKDAARALTLTKSGLPEDLHDLITGDTDETIAAQVAKLTAHLSPSDKGDDEDPDPVTPPTPSSRPKTALSPGHGGDEAPLNDLDAIVADAL